MAPKAQFTVERNPKEKGSYRRRLDDAFKALEKLKVGHLREDVAFVYYYLACEKVAKVMIGIMVGRPGASYFNKIKLRSNNVVAACHSLGCKISRQEINSIFSDAPGSACRLRNKLIHDIGPTHVIEVQRAASSLNTLMKKFLNCRDAVIDFLDQGVARSSKPGRH